MTDREYRRKLMILAEGALRRNQPRTYQMSWEESAQIPSSSEQAYIWAMSPSVVLRLLRRLERLDRG